MMEEQDFEKPIVKLIERKCCVCKTKQTKRERPCGEYPPMQMIFCIKCGTRTLHSLRVSH